VHLARPGRQNCRAGADLRRRAHHTGRGRAPRPPSHARGPGPVHHAADGHDGVVGERADGAPDMMHSLMRYKMWADAELMRAVLALPSLAAAPEGAFVTAIIRHFHTADCVFRAHLLGIPHEYTSANPREPATLAELGPRVAAIDEWYVSYTRDLDANDLSQALHVR